MRHRAAASCFTITLLVLGALATPADGQTFVGRVVAAETGAPLAGIEVYAGAASVPGEFAGLDTDCGVVAVWTRTSDHSRQP